MREYRDEEWDYGLEPGEQFEPVDLDDDTFDLTKPHVMTVLGPVDPGALGYTLPFEHLIRDDGDPRGRLDDPGAAASELEGYFATGGRAIVDAITREQGRTATDLRWIGQRVPVHVIASTGQRSMHAERSNLAEEMIRELTVSIDGSEVRAGVIQITPHPALLAAAREARRVTGAPISILVENGDALDLAVDAGTIVNLPISRIDSAPVERWLANGASVAFLGWQRDSPEIVAAATRRIAELVAAGFGDRLLISTGSTRRDTWLSYGGGPGIVHLIDRVPLDLMEAGLTAPEVRAIFFENPAAALTIYPP